MTQFLDCSVRLVCHDFDHKPWNKAAEFDLYIAPKKNTSIKMASERFTRYIKKNNQNYFECGCLKLCT